MTLLRCQNDGRLLDSMLSRAGQGFLEPDLRAIQQPASAAESEHPPGLPRIVAHQIGGHRRGAHFSLGKSPAALVAAQVRVVEQRQEHADDAGDRRIRHYIDLAARMPPDEHPLQVADQLRNHGLELPPLARDTSRPCPFVVRFRRLPQNRRLRFQRINLVERAQNGEHHVPIMHRIRNRLGKRLPQTIEQLLVVHE